MTYCTSCGTRWPEGSAFCASCGTALAQMPAAHTAAAPKPTPWGKILAGVLVLIVLLVGSVIGGMVYVGYRVKQKVAEFTKTDHAGSGKEKPMPKSPPEAGNSVKSPY